MQLCAYPKALPPGSYARPFAAGVGAPGARGLFVPLADLLGRRVPPRNYAQLASLVAFLIEEKPDWLPPIARTLADGDEIDAALKRCGTDAAALGAAWPAWGRARFPRGEVDRPTHFAMPPEFEGFGT